ncbi:MAG: ribosome maturation factor RimM [Candidatus Gastranaerophilaceae bacterium]|nr:ribosome maturation factor RimM [Candidatus Gastranaerophilaceae bacterium]
MDKYISVGKILNFHGIKGEAKVGFSRGQEDFILGLKEVFVRKDNEYIPFVVQNVRLNKNFALFKFKGIDSINELMDYKGSLIFVEESFIRENLEENEFLIDELVGMSIYDNDGNKLGFVIGVSNNGANDLLSVKTNTKHVSLIPFVEAFIKKVDIKEKAITINNIAGLLE